MKYFNGFSLQGEEYFFNAYLIDSEYCVAGFSYGAQEALEYVYHNRKNQRIDRLILLSPAFFHSEKPSFIRTQLHYFRQNTTSYIEQFLANVLYPSKKALSSNIKKGSEEELASLLHYQWEEEKLQVIQDRGTVIEVFLGEKDKIIKSQEAFDFFKNKTITYWIKGAGHLLQEEESHE